MASKSTMLNTLRRNTDISSSGICFIGSPGSNFHLIIRCPVHVYVVIKRAFDGSSIPTKFYSGCVTISQLCLDKFQGKFIYRDSSNRTKKFNAAFVYPLDLYEVTEDELLHISALFSVFMSNKFEFYDKQDRSLKTLISMFAFDVVSDVSSLIENFESAL